MTTPPFEPEAIEYGENFVVHREGPEATPYLPNVIASVLIFVIAAALAAAEKGAASVEVSDAESLAGINDRAQLADADGDFGTDVGRGVAAVENLRSLMRIRSRVHGCVLPL